MGKLFGPQDELANQKAKILMEQVNPFSGSMELHELVRRVREGDAAKWQTTAEEMSGVAAGNEEAANAGREMLQALESSWSGEGAEAASQAVGSSIKVTQDAADIYQRNSAHLTTNSGQFEDIKNRLPDVPAKEPETGAWDTVTPWDTDAEDAANKYKADVEAARSMYSGYEGNVHRSAYDMQADFGQMEDLGGDFGSMERGGSGSGDDSGSGVIDIPGTGDGGSGDTSRPGGYDGSVGGGPERGGTPVPPGGGYQSPHVPTPTGPNSPNDSTGTSGYTSPSTVTPPAANYPTPNAPGVPGNTGYGPNGGPGTGFGTSGYGAPGFGPRGTPGTSGFGPGGSSSGGTGGRFSAPGMGRAGGYSGGGGYSGAGAAGGGGGAPGSGAAPGAGRMTGASPGGFGPTGSGGAAAAGGGSGSGAAGGRGGMMGGMGGAGRGGQGGDDEEHQRKYLADTDEAFTLTDEGEVLRDPVTGHVVTPPTIGE
ncbi:hypothetical protein [Prauserella alba]|uniref:PPE family protein n=1 Tax=Prauserella alba TaxID=176898 RepID=A0ABP4FZF8_9PSEU|nr:hypothetical protein [Prauserella alba]MCP2182395.1 hypothetical protein [Prauserella alba]